mmetsp:Transcript_24210/g.46013  ORF Transcript_24210/g.46013 Transcript_24210/m.46013 type:complete len:694 (-) Transcript_24210:297-2378(-)
MSLQVSYSKAAPPLSRMSIHTLGVKPKREYIYASNSFFKQITSSDGLHVNFVVSESHCRKNHGVRRQLTLSTFVHKQEHCTLTIGFCTRRNLSAFRAKYRARYTMLFEPRASTGEVDTSASSLDDEAQMLRPALSFMPSEAASPLKDNDAKATSASMCRTETVDQASAGEGALLLPELTKRQRKMVYKAEKQRVKLRKRNKRKEVKEKERERSEQEAREAALRKYARSAATLAVGALTWHLPHSAAVSDQGWHLVAIFLATTSGLILQPLPLGAVALLGLLTTLVTNTLTFSQAFGVFSSPVPWQAIAAFMFARGVQKSNLGNRAAYALVSKFGHTPLGLSYSLVVGEILVSLAVPSKSARAGGLFAPLIKSIAGSEPPQPGQASLGQFLTLSQYQTSASASALVLTGTPFSLLCTKLASDYISHDITWAGWLAASCAPVLVGVLLTPPLMQYMYPPPPTNPKDEQPAEMAAEKLAGLGRLSRDEGVVLGTLALTVTLWSVGDSLLGINNATTSLLGVGMLLLGDVLTWEDCLSEKNGWDCFMWFSIMITLAAGLDNLGVVQVLSSGVSEFASGIAMEWPEILLALLIVYTYSHYMFASAIAQVSLMYPAFLAVAISCGAPAYPSALAFAYASHLMSSLTHYSSANSPIFYNLGYCSLRTWWTAAFVSSLAQGTVWVVVGGLWWEVLGIWKEM